VGAYLVWKTLDVKFSFCRMTTILLCDRFVKGTASAVPQKRTEEKGLQPLRYVYQ